MKTQKTLLLPLMIFAILAFSCISWQSPVPNLLSNTKWIGFLNIPAPTEGILKFKKDTVLAYVGDEIIETMSYQTKGDTLIFKKLSGTSPCDDQVGYYKYDIKAEVLTFYLIKDDCPPRTTTFSSDGYKKQAD